MLLIHAMTRSDPSCPAIPSTPYQATGLWDQMNQWDVSPCKITFSAYIKACAARFVLTVPFHPHTVHLCCSCATPRIFPGPLQLDSCSVGKALSSLLHSAPLRSTTFPSPLLTPPLRPTTIPRCKSFVEMKKEKRRQLTMMRVDTDPNKILDIAFKQLAIMQDRRQWIGVGWGAARSSGGGGVTG